MTLQFRRKGRADGADQFFGTEGLVQESNCACPQRSSLLILLGARGDENDGKTVPGFAKETLEIQAVHAGHPHVEEQAGPVFDLRRAQEIPSGGKRGGSEAERADKPFSRISHRIVVIHDKNERVFIHPLSFQTIPTNLRHDRDFAGLLAGTLTICRGIAWAYREPSPSDGSGEGCHHRLISSHDFSLAPGVAGLYWTLGQFPNQGLCDRGYQALICAFGPPAGGSRLPAIRTNSAKDSASIFCIT